MELSELRARLDVLDKQLLALFTERMGIAADVAAVKKRDGLALYQPDREQQILERVGAEAGELGGYARALFSTLMALSRSYQAHLGGAGDDIVRAFDSASVRDDFPRGGNVACQGVTGAFSEEACLGLMPDAHILFFKNFDAVFSAVESGLCAYGVLPAENSTHGTVSRVYDLMLEHRFSIVRSTKLKVSQSLLAPSGVGLRDIREVISHEQALGQCRAYLEKLGVTATAVENTAVAAKTVAESGRRDLAALSSARCAELYGLDVLAGDVQDESSNFTRFICIAPEMRIYPGANKLSFVCSLKHIPGALYSLISRIAALGLNLTKLESRPIPGRDFEFTFYFDIEADPSDPDVRALIGELETVTESFRFLGAYSEV